MTLTTWFYRWPAFVVLSIVSLGATFSFASQPSPKPPEKDEDWIGKNVVPKPRVTFRAAGTNAPLDVSELPKLPWKIAHVKGDWLWMGNTWVKRQDVEVLSGTPDMAAKDELLVRYGEAIRAEPGNAQHYIDRAQIRFPKGENELAILDLDDAIRIDPKSDRALSERAFRYSMLGKHRQAVADNTAAIKIKPDPHHFVMRAHDYADLGMHPEALADFAAAIKLDPVGGRTSRASYYQDQKKHDLALADLDAAIKADPDKNVGIRLHRAWLLATCPDGKIRSGKRALEEAKAVYDSKSDLSLDALDTLAAAYAETGDFEKAVQTQEEVIKHAKEGNLVVKALERRLALYRDKKPYRETKRPDPFSDE